MFEDFNKSEQEIIKTIIQDYFNYASTLDDIFDDGDEIFTQDLKLMKKIHKLPKFQQKLKAIGIKMGV